MNKITLLRFLKVSCFLIFVGRGYQHLFWDGPYRSLFWDQNLLEPIVIFFFNTTWHEYVTDLRTDNAIQFLTKSIGIFYVVCAVLSVSINFNSKLWKKNLLKMGAVSLLFLSLLLTKDKFYHLAMFFEHAIQFGVPIALLYFLKYGNVKNVILQLKILITLTFTCHGMYAIGVLYPLPGDFVTMTLNIIPVTEKVAKELLFMVGVLDFGIAVFIFNKRIEKYILLYAALWGLITALARIVSGFSYDISLSIIHQYLYLVFYRIPHGLIPLLVYLYQRKVDRIKKPKQEALVLNSI